ncbi:MAG TPA: hypothetical protein VGO47_09330 [Chlamydiales bacterium]|nr:hypothetical protein [Chlamydiales bacterium]
MASELANGDQRNYQESVSLSTSRSDEDDAVLREDEEDPIGIKDTSLLSPYEKVVLYSLLP